MYGDYINLIFYPIEVDVHKMTELIPESDDEDSLQLFDIFDKLIS